MRPLGTSRVEVASVSQLDWRKAFSDSKNFFHSPELTTLRVCLLTTVAGVLMLLSVLLASYRRSSKNRMLKAVLWASYTLTGYLITFTLGQMLHSTSSNVNYSDNIIWALYLLIVFGSEDSFSSYSLADSDQWRRYNCQFTLKLGGLMILLVSSYQIFEQPLTGPIMLLSVLVIISKVLMKNLSIEASGTSALNRSCKRIVDYMITEHEGVGDAAQADPLSMRGYRYLVQGEPLKTQGSDETGHIVTLENVWNCRWELLSSRHTGDHLKDMCVSFSLYRLLRLKYAGYKLPRKVHTKVFRLVRHGLMASEENGYERAFRVVEDELALLFDSFYTKRPIIFEPWGHRLWFRFAEFLLLGLISSVFIYVILVSLIKQTDWEPSWADVLYLTTSLIASVIYLLSEILQPFILLFTTWMKVMLICKYVKGDLWQKRPFCRMCIERICKLCSFKPWERKLHQYSLFESYTYSPPLLFPKRFVCMFIDSPREGQLEDIPRDLSAEVRKAVFDCLKNVTDSTSNDGITYLRTPHVSRECDVHLELETQAEVIMVWHIATTMCSRQPSSPEGKKNLLVAITLSNYLAYLVAFVPRLLPDHAGLTESFFDQTIAEARLLFKGCKTVTERIDKLRESERESGKNNTTLIRGAKLAKQLSGVKDEAAIWETLAKFWTEMMLYIAPSKDNGAHAEMLAFGGEFVTHLWALLYHAGIERSKVSMPSHQHVIDMSDEASPSTMPMTSDPAAPPVSMEINPSTMPPTSEPAAPPVSTEIEDAVVPPMITDKKQTLG